MPHDSTRAYDQLLKTLADDGVIGADASIIGEHRGSTEAAVVQVEDGGRQLAVKFESPEVVANVSAFLRSYEHVDLFPNLLYTAPDDSFLVYPFVGGGPFEDDQLGEGVVAALIGQVLNRSVGAARSDWGTRGAPSTSLRHHLQTEIDVRAGIVGAVLGATQTDRMRTTVDRLFSNFSGRPFLLHGDLGVHNFVVENGDVVGIIDPLVVHSLPILELLFLICSKPHHFGVEGVVRLCGTLDESSGFGDADLIDLYRLSLYNRVANCAWHHPDDLPAYVRLYAELDA